MTWRPDKRAVSSRNLRQSRIITGRQDNTAIGWGPECLPTLLPARKAAISGRIRNNPIKISWFDGKLDES
jgi:hypothetical protein